MDETDVKRILSFRKNKPEEEKPQPPINTGPEAFPTIPNPNDDYYNMKHKHRGIALIFNHYKFDKFDFQPRKGTDIDCKRIEKTLKSLKFEVKVFDDLKYGQLKKQIQTVAEMDHTENDCLVVVVMTHGDPEILQARDEAYYVNALWEPFVGNKCPTLAGKPKIFFLQACRGDKTDAGVCARVEFDGPQDKKPTIVKIPSMADFIIMYPTQMGLYSFRSPNNGSWFIQALCDELDDRAKHHDLQTILTFVNRRMSFGYQSNVPSNSYLHGKKQVGSIVSSLTRLIHFNS